jgi:hypothetical protein
VIHAGKTVTVLAGGDDGGNCSARHRHNANGTVFPLRGKPSSTPPHQQGSSVPSGNDVLG